MIDFADYMLVKKKDVEFGGLYTRISNFTGRFSKQASKKSRAAYERLDLFFSIQRCSVCG